jgi:hypothetical protein
MRDPAIDREIARQCRLLLKLTANSEVSTQLQHWAVECDRKADRALRTSPSTDLLEQARRHLMRAEEYRAAASQMRDPTARASFQHLAEIYKAMARRLERSSHRSKQGGRQTGRTG